MTQLLRSDRSTSRWRAFILLSLVLVIAATASVYLLRRWQAERNARPLPPRISEKVDQQTQSFSLSKTLADNTVYTIEAEQVTNYKDSGKALLRGVSIHIFGKDGSRDDRITTAECEYDPALGSVFVPGEVTLDFGPLAKEPVAEPGGAAVSVTTSQLSFDQKTGNAATQELVRFRFAQGEGTSVGADYDRAADLIRLSSQVDFLIQGRSDSQPTRVQARELLFFREQQKVFLNGAVQVTKAGRQVRAEHAEVLLDQDFRAQSARLEGNVMGQEAGAGLEAEIGAAQAALQFSPQGSLRQIELSGQVHWSSTGPSTGQERQGEAGRVVLDFDAAQTSLRAVEAEESVRLVFAGRASAGTRVVSGERVAMRMAKDGRTPVDAQVLGSPKLELRGAKPESAARVVTAERFDMTFDHAGRLSQVDAANHVRVSATKERAAAAAQTATSDSLTALFDAASGELSRIRQSGTFHYADAEREASADQADYSAADEVITLTGEPAVWSRDMRITGRTLKLHTIDNALEAEGAVASTAYPAPSPQEPRPDPVHIAADRLRYQSANGTAKYDGAVRMWRGSDALVQADTLELNREQSLLRAENHVYSVFRDANQEAPRGGTSKPGTREAAKVIIRADWLVYRGPEQKASYGGGVSMESSQGRLRARELDLEFTSSGGAHGLPAPGFGIGQGRIRRAEARGDVEMAQQDRSGKGDRAEYLPEQEEIRLYGAPASLFDPRRGLTQGVRLTYHIADDRLLIEGEPGLPTETRWKLHP